LDQSLSILPGKLAYTWGRHKLMNRGAGGKNADLTSSLVQVCQETIGIECVMHLCCTESKLNPRNPIEANRQCPRRKSSGL
jgi:5,10-methylenetetrahydrofolate reductase